MKADYLTFRRGTSVSILGFAIQLVLALAFLIYAQYSRDHAAFTAALYLGLGLLVWFTLGVMFDLHRRERLEALEIDSFGATESGSAFTSGEEEIREAARRLAAMQRFFVPAMSLLIAVGLIAIGWWRLADAQTIVHQEATVDAALPGWGISIGIGAAFVGFVFARFVAGMAKQKVWASLRAGAAYAVGAALLGLALAVSHFINYAGKEDVALRYMPAAFAIALIVLGCEVIVNFAMDIYRPRRPGEDPRAALDSRVLGFLAAPDKIAESLGEAINYQFGIDVTGSWFYKLLSRSLATLAVLAAATAWLLTGLVVIEPHQRAMILTWGTVTRADVGPGLHFKWPWPISTVEIPEQVEMRVVDGRPVESRLRTVEGVRVLHIGTNPPDEDKGPILWTKQHALNEQFLIVQPSKDAVPAGSSPAPSGDSKDVALVAVEVPVHYVVKDVRLFDEVASPEVRDRLFTSLGRRVVMNFASTLTVDQVLTTDRSRLAEQLRAELTREFGRLNGGRGAGIEILFVGIEGVHPPMKVAPQFEQVIGDRQKRDMAIEDAQRYKIERLTTAAGTVDRAETIASKLDQLDTMMRAGADETEIAEYRLEIQHDLEAAGGEMGALLIQASAQRWTRHMGERGRSALHQGQVASYTAAPELYRAKKYFEALAEVMVGARVFIVPENTSMVRLELQDARSTEVFNPEAGGP